MTRHLLRLMWNRKQRNALVCIEIFFCFVVVAVIAVMALNYGNNVRQGIGYRIAHVWNVEYFPPNRDNTGAFPPGTEETVRQMMTAAKSLAGVQSVAAMAIAPYSFSESQGLVSLTDGRKTSIFYNGGSDDLLDALGLELVAGRWFSAGDTSGTADPVVINKRLAHDVFGDRDPIGQLLPDVPPPRQNPRYPWRPRRIIGVLREFRKDGEFATPQPYLFGRVNLSTMSFGNNLMVRTAPGVPAAFEETLQKTLQGLARDWNIMVRPLEDDRRTSIRIYLAILVVPAIIATFVLLMVALGLIGVLWQHVTERTREFGLRRANGASAAAIRRQVMLELALLASFALVPGAILGFQMPALPIPDYLVPGRIIVAGVAVSVVAIYLVVLACGWYPSRMATAIRPAEALHYE